MPRPTEFVLTLSCRDTKGIVHAVSGLLFQAGCNIIDSQQFGDVEGEDATGLFFMRVHFAARRTWPTCPPLRSSSPMCAASSRWTRTSMRWRSARGCC